MSKASISVANLESIGYTIVLYHRDLGVYPPCLSDLEAADYTTRKQYISPCDPGAIYAPTGPAYSSYIYHPGVGSLRQDSSLVLAFEKGAWTLADLRMFSGHRRHVLFADGSVRKLTDSEFKAALQQDEKRRFELGWPVCEWDETGVQDRDDSSEG
ncbi:MAG: hypothetical protein JXQ75_15865 [Phycisphaerae bacterium]|nr:hypothetical protein [Phycisphaerae bacterium]